MTNAAQKAAQGSDQGAAQGSDQGAAQGANQGAAQGAAIAAQEEIKKLMREMMRELKLWLKDELLPLIIGENAAGGKNIKMTKRPKEADQKANQGQGAAQGAEDWENEWKPLLDCQFPRPIVILMIKDGITWERICQEYVRGGIGAVDAYIRWKKSPVTLHGPAVQGQEGRRQPSFRLSSKRLAIIHKCLKKIYDHLESSPPRILTTSN